MEKITELIALPGCCWKCRSSNREWYLDLGISVELYGAVFICNECIWEMGSVAGMLSVDGTEQLRNRNIQLEDEKFALEVRVTGLEQAIDGLRIAGRPIGVNPVNSITHPVSQDVQSTPTGQDQLGSPPGNASQSLHDERVAELSDDGSSQPGSSFQFSL